MKKEDFVIRFNWGVTDKTSKPRVGAMYCFKNCDIHKN